MEKINQELFIRYMEFMEECSEMQYEDVMEYILNGHYMNELSAYSYDSDAIFFGEMA